MNLTAVFSCSTRGTLILLKLNEIITSLIHTHTHTHTHTCRQRGVVWDRLHQVHYVYANSLQCHCKD